MSASPSMSVAFAMPRYLQRALRSDQAGETGAVAIYRGILAVSRAPEVRAFARAHLQAEQRHLASMNRALPRDERSRLLPLWSLAGWITGALPALFGAAAVFRTIETVETFVDRHYREQIDYLRRHYYDARLLQLLEACREDELAHRDDARARIGAPGAIGIIWGAIVAAGSKVGVFFAGRI